MVAAVHSPEILIAGAGPTGLAAALFLAERGIAARIVERDSELSRQSRALAVNPRTLALLADTEVRSRLLEEGWRARAANFHGPCGRVAHFEIAPQGHPERYLLVIPQARTEALLAAALEARGIAVERDCALLDFETNDDGVTARLETSAGQEASARVDLLLGADGAHSACRHAAGLDFAGHTYPEAWRLCDVTLETPLAADEAHAFLLPGGFVFAMRLKDDVWRLISNLADPLGRLPTGSRAGAVHWESEFHIAHRMVERMRDGFLFLAGDAAHIHSPIGGRGMNLGIEDAYVFAALAARGELARYAPMREPVDAAFVRQAARVTELPRGRTLPAQLLRHAGPLLPLLPRLAGNGVRDWLLGLDHPVVA